MVKSILYILLSLFLCAPSFNAKNNHSPEKSAVAMPQDTTPDSVENFFSSLAYTSVRKLSKSPGKMVRKYKFIKQFNAGASGDNVFLIECKSSGTKYILKIFSSNPIYAASYADSTEQEILDFFKSNSAVTVHQGGNF